MEMMLSKRTLVFVLLFTLLFHFAAPILAEDMAPSVFVEGQGDESVPKAGLSATTFGIHELKLEDDWLDLGDLSESEIGRLTSKSAPYDVVGVIREFATRPVLRVASGSPTSSVGRVSRLEGSTYSWTVGVRSPHATGIRIGLRVRGTTEAQVWLASASEAIGPLPIPSDAEYLTPTIFSDSVLVEVRAPYTENVEVEINRVAHISWESATSLAAVPESTDCLRDASCFTISDYPATEWHRNATAIYVFEVGGQLGACSGALLNDTVESSRIPYLLTANHCIDTSVKAFTAEFFFDYSSSYCGGPAPELSTRPRVVGSTLLAYSAVNDFSFLRLSSLPSNRWLLGWWALSSLPSSTGAVLHRVSHPGARVQHYSRGTVNTTNGTCSGVSRDNYIYSVDTLGGVEGGSSGSLIQYRHPDTGNYHVVGQLRGNCGPAPADPCDRRNSTTDGLFAVTYPYIKQWLRPDDTGGNTPCSATTSKFCTQSKRFEVSISARDPRTGKIDSGHVMSSTDFFGYFAFPVLAGNTTDPQVFAKVLDGRPINGKFWVFYASLTDNEFTLTIRDTQTGAQKTYRQNPYTQDAKNDINAF